MDQIRSSKSYPTEILEIIDASLSLILICLGLEYLLGLFNVITLVSRLISDNVNVCASLGLNADSLSSCRKAAYTGLAEAIN